MSFIKGSNRKDPLIIEALEEFVPPNSIVRLIDVLVDSLVESDPDFYLSHGRSLEGRPAYHPSVFLKLYLYGYRNGIHSSRKLEVECKRNLELMWLLGRLAPDFKTIANYRKDHFEQLGSVFSQFTIFLRDHKLIKGKLVSLDGTKIRAYGSKSSNQRSLEKSVAASQEKLAHYLGKIDHQDEEEDEDDDIDSDGGNHPPAAPELGETTLSDRIAEAIEKIEKNSAKLEELKRNDQNRRCNFDPDARLMKSRNGSHWSYNVQATIDGTHKLIADIAATQSAVDKKELKPALERLAQSLRLIPETVIADAGYSNIEEILSIEHSGIKCFIPTNDNQYTLLQKKHKLTFDYDEQEDHFICSEGAILRPVRRNQFDSRNGSVADIYRADDCRNCSRKAVCAPKTEKARSVKRFHNQHQRDDYLKQLNGREGQKMKIKRMSLSEHPFGTLKGLMGKTPVTTTGIDKVNAEIKIYAAVYNIIRAANIFSVELMIEYIKSYDWKAAKSHVKRIINGFVARYSSIVLRRQIQNLKRYFEKVSKDFTLNIEMGIEN